MTTLDYRDPALRMSAGLMVDGAEIISKLSHSPRTPRRYFDRVVVADAVSDLLRSSNHPMSRRDVARCLGYSKHPGLISILNDLAASGSVLAFPDAYHGRLMWLYQWIGD